MTPDIFLVWAFMLALGGTAACLGLAAIAHVQGRHRLAWEVLGGALAGLVLLYVLVRYLP